MDKGTILTQRILDLVIKVNLLFNNTSALHKKYEVLFKAIDDHSNAFKNFLHIHANLKKGMVIPLEFKQTTLEVENASTRLLIITTKAMKDYYIKMDLIKMLLYDITKIEKTVNQKSFDRNKLSEDFNNAESNYMVAYKMYTQMQSELIDFQNQLNDAQTIFGRLKN